MYRGRKTRAGCITTTTTTTAAAAAAAAADDDDDDDVTVIRLLTVQKLRSRARIISWVTVVCWKIYGRRV